MAVIKYGSDDAGELSRVGSSGGARVTLVDGDGNEIYGDRWVDEYMSSSGHMAMSTTAAGVCVFCLDNPSGSGKDIYINRLTAIVGFSGTAAATYHSYGLTRATGTSAGGSGTRTLSNIIKCHPQSPNSISTVRFGPTAITGLTPDTAGDFAGWLMNHQNGTPMSVDILNQTHIPKYEPLVIIPGTSLAIYTRTATSVAGASCLVNLRWYEA